MSNLPIRTPDYYKRRAIRRLYRVALYCVLGSLTGGLFIVTAGLYLPMFL